MKRYLNIVTSILVMLAIVLKTEKLLDNLMMMEVMMRDDEKI